MMGVYLDKRSGSWVARSKSVNGKRHYIGAYKTRAEAQEATGTQFSTMTYRVEFDEPTSLWSRFKSLWSR